jgi:large subunit ribosomal protein L29
MEFKEIKTLSVTELNKKRKTLAKEMFELKIKNSLGQLANPQEIRVARRNLARLQTAIHNHANQK